MSGGNQSSLGPRASCLHRTAAPGRTTAFTCRAGGKERDVSEKRDAGPVKCNALFYGLLTGEQCRAKELTQSSRDELVAVGQNRLGNRPHVVVHLIQWRVLAQVDG